MHMTHTTHIFYVALVVFVDKSQACALNPQAFKAVGL